MWCCRMNFEKLRDCTTVAKWGAASRVWMFVIQLISNNVIPDHQGSMEDVFLKDHRHPPLDVITETLVGGFDNWDSEYFLFLAQHGYSRYERTLAFFPLYPMNIRLLGKTVLSPLGFITNQRSIFLISSVLLNFIIFPIAVVVLYLLTVEMSKSRKISILAAALFCVNPASVFMSAAYTECLFCLLTFSGLLALQKRHLWVSGVFFALAGATRSNGMVLCGFIAYYCITEIYTSFLYAKSFKVLAARVVKVLLAAFAQCCIAALPFVLFQSYGYYLYCTEQLPASDSAARNHLPLPPWCSWKLPIPYSYIQDHYWNVGFLRYYELKQLPNFLLASPTMLLSTYCFWEYFSGKGCLKETAQLRPYVYHLGFLLLFGIFNINIQVITRFIFSSSPVIYWYSAAALLSALTALKKEALLETGHLSLSQLLIAIYKVLFSRWQSCVQTSGHEVVAKASLVFFLGYFIIGCILHCNFLPWT